MGGNMWDGNFWTHPVVADPCHPDHTYDEDDPITRPPQSTSIAQERVDLIISSFIYLHPPCALHDMLFVLHCRRTSPSPLPLDWKEIPPLGGTGNIWVLGRSKTQASLVSFPPQAIPYPYYMNFRRPYSLLLCRAHEFPGTPSRLPTISRLYAEKPTILGALPTNTPIPHSEGAQLYRTAIEFMIPRDYIDVEGQRGCDGVERGPVDLCHDTGPTS